MVPALQIAVSGLYVPWLAVAETKVKLAGRMLVTRTLVAGSGPLLVRLMGDVIVSPTFGRALLSVLARARSACVGVSVALALSLAVLASNWSLRVMLAVLVWASGLVTVARICSVCGAVVEMLPAFQIPVAAL